MAEPARWCGRLAGGRCIGIWSAKRYRQSKKDGKDGGGVTEAKKRKDLQGT
jgi:hypothetical protein